MLYRDHEEPIYKKKIPHKFSLQRKNYTKLSEFYFMTLASAHYHYIPVLNEYISCMKLYNTMMADIKVWGNRWHTETGPEWRKKHIQYEKHVKKCKALKSALFDEQRMHKMVRLYESVINFIFRTAQIDPQVLHSVAAPLKIHRFL